MLTTGGNGNKRKIPDELSPSAALLLGLLRQGPKTWGELVAMGFEPRDLCESVAELVLAAQISFLVGGRGIALSRWDERRCNGGPEKAA
jgi:hypothetical protein